MTSLRLQVLCLLFAYTFSADLCRNVDTVVNATAYRVNRYRNTYDITGCFCEGKPCIRKCCRHGYGLEGYECLPKGNISFLVPVRRRKVSVEKGDVSFLPIEGLMVCGQGYFKLVINATLKQFYVQPDGWMVIQGARRKQAPNEYCLDRTKDGFLAFLCFPKEDLQRKVNWTGMMISLPFLLATFLVYLIIPERNLHGKCLMCYVITLCFSYILLIILQLDTHYDDVPCITMGLFCVFFFLVSFFWMNVMCIDIWWTFSGLRGFSGSKREAENKRFLLYSAYAWGVPLLIISIVLLLRFGGFVSETSWYFPNIGVQQCGFSGEYPSLLYFYGPMAILTTANIILFIITALKIKQVKKDTAMLRKDESKRHSYENDKQRFNLYLKLLLAMGINWSMEVVSWAVNWQVGEVPPEIWYLTDFCNACYGVFIFFIFVFKKNIWLLLKKRYYMIIGKPYMARIVSGTTPRTVTSTLSYTNTNDRSTAPIESTAINS